MYLKSFPRSSYSVVWGACAASLKKHKKHLMKYFFMVIRGFLQQERHTRGCILPLWYATFVSNFTFDEESRHTLRINIFYRPSHDIMMKLYAESKDNLQLFLCQFLIINKYNVKYRQE